MTDDDVNPLEEIMRRACAHVNHDYRAIAEIFEHDRQQCADRGYHRVSDEPKETGQNELMICYDCELWFGSKDYWITYKIEPH